MYKILHHKNFLKPFFCFLIGIVAYCFYQEWIIITVRLGMRSNDNNQLTTEQKELVYFFSKADQWHTERSRLLWGKDQLHNLHAVIEQWVAIGKIEGLLDKKVKVQAVIIGTDNKTAYISFNESPLSQEQAIYQKLKVVEGLLKTIKAQNFTITHIQFLKNHQPLQDLHLDFTEIWPLEGFSQQSI